VETTADPSPTPEEPRTIEETFAALTTVVGDAVAGEDMEGKLGEEVLKKAGEAIEKHQEGTLEDALKKMAEAREKLAEGSEKGEVSPAAAAEVDAALQALAEALQSTPPPTGGGDDDDGGEGKGKGRDKGKGNDGDDDDD
jgi:hypothetical protein